jgi:uncharacterized membrane protein YtjA (UPF0391 family)
LFVYLQAVTLCTGQAKISNTAVKRLKKPLTSICSIEITHDLVRRQQAGPSEDVERVNIQYLKEENMLYWAAVFFIVAIIAAVFGFGGIAAGAASIAQVLFYIFLIVFLVSLIMGLMHGHHPRV